jgi:hypothetical protein
MSALHQLRLDAHAFLACRHDVLASEQIDPCRGTLIE